jgi:hypothetical protein
VVPGFRNKMMVFMMTRLMSRHIVGSMFRKMMGESFKYQFQTKIN